MLTRRHPIHRTHHAVLCRQPRQERSNLGRAHVPGVFQLMKPYESTYPIDINFLGTYAVMPVPNTLTHLIKQADRFEQWPVSRLAGFHRMFSTAHKKQYINEKLDDKDVGRDATCQYRYQAGKKPYEIDVNLTLCH